MLKVSASKENEFTLPQCNDINVIYGRSHIVSNASEIISEICTVNSGSSAVTVSTHLPEDNKISNFALSTSSNSTELLSTSTSDIYAKRKELISFNFSLVYALSLGIPIFSLVLVFVIGIIADSDKLFYYDWDCGKAVIPSVSRIINLPLERTIWNFGILGHIPLSGIAELIFIIALTVVGERESPQMHVVFFSSFMAACALYFMMISRSSGSKIKRRIRAMFTLILYCLIVIITTSFFLNLNFCVKHAYTVFVASEYITVVVIYVFHAMTARDFLQYSYSFVIVK
ncbi:frag1/DRAM/Sfk1 family domain-containing protein [Ditylenchus destructor]|nr:frag1/DRAM/Sfk1 family domain-containing protein [Ditylenchus destructor]